MDEWRGAPRTGDRVDHRPPPEVEDSIVVTLSGHSDQPPYGLIANESEVDQEREDPGDAPK